MNASTGKKLLYSPFIIINNTKTPKLTFLGVKKGANPEIFGFAPFSAEREGYEPTPQYP